MIYVKSVAAGVVGAVAGAVLMVGLQVLAFVLLAVIRGGAATGSGSIAGISVLGPTIPMVVFAAAGFVAGFWLVYRRRSSTRQNRRV
jgi:hypothetical protein